MRLGESTKYPPSLRRHADDIPYDDDDEGDVEERRALIERERQVERDRDAAVARARGLQPPVSAVKL